VAELIPESYVDRLNPHEIFGRSAPLQVDLGCGDGSFLCALAGRMPQKNFLGVERLLGRVRSAARKAASIENVRVLRVETFYAVRYLLPAQSVETFHLLFPDPWPKRRHHRRRIMTNDFLATVWATLVENGALRIATDHAGYFQHISKLVAALPQFAAVEPEQEHGFPVSTFEQKFAASGAKIYRLELRKNLRTCCACRFGHT
jgi:tRNA (guanine-N7-)-methyltransferase